MASHGRLDVLVNNAARAVDESPSKKLRTRHVTMITLGGIIAPSVCRLGEHRSRHGPSLHVDPFRRRSSGVRRHANARRDGRSTSRRGAVHGLARVTLGNWAAYIVGWLYWYFWAGVIAYEAVVSGGMLHAWFLGIPAWAGSLTLLAVFVATNVISL